jgi:hypothetical protein
MEQDHCPIFSSKESKDFPYQKMGELFWYPTTCQTRERKKERKKEG